MKKTNVAIILVGPENPDNIGAVARALKNTGFSDLRLVRPPRPWRLKGRKMAMAARDVLDRAKVCGTLEAAVRDRNFVLGTTRRAGAGRGSFLPFREAVARARSVSEKGKVGFVFGCESKGLANKDIALCDRLVTFPANSKYPSFNLAQAVMVALFTLSIGDETGPQDSREPFLDKRGTGLVLKHFQTALKALGYRRGGSDLLPRILRTMDGLFKRGGLLEAEAQMFKGLSRRIREKVLS
ncbi:MAG: RNA methyltransferase [Candidatus Omnitrophica bacterium]|nr:RNA methyltransferase [Candidatus Omnitrophota bacterium]